MALAARHGPDDQEGLLSGDDLVGQCSIRRMVRQIFLAGKESDEWPALQADLVADRPAQDRMTCLERVEHSAQRNGTLHFKQHLAVHTRQAAQMIRERHAYHGSVCTSTDSTAGRSRTMG